MCYIHIRAVLYTVYIILIIINICVSDSITIISFLCIAIDTELNKTLYVIYYV